MDYAYEIAKLQDEMKNIRDAENERLRKTISEIKAVASRNDITDRVCCEKVISMCRAALL